MKFSLDSSTALYISLLAEWIKYCPLIANHSFEQLKHSLISKNLHRGACYREGGCDLLSFCFFSVRHGRINAVLFHNFAAGGMFWQNFYYLLWREARVNSYRSHSKSFNFNSFSWFQSWYFFCIFLRSAASCQLAVKIYYIFSPDISF